MSVVKRGSELQELAKAANKTNRNRNQILTVAVALAIIVLFSILSIAKGKIRIDQIKNIREKGTNESAYLEMGSEEEYQKLKQIGYVETIGKNYIVGDWYEEDIALARFEVLDKTGYEKIVKPAYGNIVGAYPSIENEVMMPKRLLHVIGIDSPQVGMNIPVVIHNSNWSMDNSQELKETFILSGYYQDYVDEVANVPIAYLSQKFLSVKDLFGNPDKILIKFNLNGLSSGLIEDQLYHDVELKYPNQKFVASHSEGYQAVEQLAGGYGIAVLCAFVLILSIYLLIYNILSISLNRDIAQYGLLFTIGMTEKQIKRLVHRQSFGVLIKGSLWGSGISILIAYLGFPVLFKDLYLHSSGNLGVGAVFYPDILIVAIVFITIVTLSASGHAARKIRKLSPIEAYRYGGTTKSRRKRIKAKKGASLWEMAWRNIFSSKRKFVIALAALFLGCEATLGAVVIVKGMDTMNELLQKPDFQVATNSDAREMYLSYSDSPEGLMTPLLDEAVIEQIISIDGVDESSMQQIYGSYGYIDTEETFMRPTNVDSDQTGNSSSGVTIQVVNDEYIEKLASYIEDQQMNTDMDSFKHGMGILVLHEHAISRGIGEYTKNMVGELAHIYMDDDVYSDGDGMEFICSGYLDTTSKDFPTLDMSGNSNDTNYFIISETGFKRFGAVKQVFQFTIDAKGGQEEAVKEQLTELIGKKNNERDVKMVYDLSCTSDELTQAKNYMNASRIVMMTFSLVLLLMGVANYLNVVVTNIMTRNKEFAVMESVGMTKKQLRKMLIIEGLYYCAILMTCLLSVGSLIVIGLGAVIKRNIEHFRFIYPIQELLIIAIILLVLCILVQQIMYKKTMEKSSIERLREE